MNLETWPKASYNIAWFYGPLSLSVPLSLFHIFLEDYGSNFFKCILLESYRTNISGFCIRFVYDINNKLLWFTLVAQLIDVS